MEAENEHFWHCCQDCSTKTRSTSWLVLATSCNKHWQLPDDTTLSPRKNHYLPRVHTVKGIPLWSKNENFSRRCPTTPLSGRRARPFANRMTAKDFQDDAQIYASWICWKSRISAEVLVWNWGTLISSIWVFLTTSSNSRILDVPDRQCAYPRDISKGEYHYKTDLRHKSTMLVKILKKADNRHSERRTGGGIILPCTNGRLDGSGTRASAE